MRPDLDYFELLAEAKSEATTDRHKTVRLALLADCATQHLAPLFKTLFRRSGIAIEIYQGSFEGIEFDVRNSKSALYRFEPQIVLIINSVQMLRDRFYSRTNVQSFCEGDVRRMTDVWESVRANSNAVIIQSTFATPIERFFGNYDRGLGESLWSVVTQLNSFLTSESKKRQGFFLLDLERIASWVGGNSWFDERLWAIAKILCSLDHLPLVAQNVVDIVLATQGRSIKCIVVDLDNTLWGGVVGDEGPHGIRIGAHGDGEPFFRVQCFLRELKRRGLLLAVCSKNDHENAIRPFLDNSEMVLRLDDFVAFMANWNNKPDNIRSIQQSLNIGLDSILFLDDNPFERQAVRAMIPEVIVPEVPEDPADWIKNLSELNLFESVSFSHEDHQRSDLYQREAKRRAAAETAANFEDFLQSLDMCMEVSRFIPEQIPRIVQLLQRSNQFNLTTRRHNEAQCLAMMHDAHGCIPLYARLKDKFGDHGLISIVILKPDHSARVLNITDWLMSCRVLTRGVEEFLVNYVFEQARALEAEKVAGSYIPSPKNQMVKDFYSRFGFEKVSAGANGVSHWALATSSYCPRQVFIQPNALKSVTAA